MKIAVTGITGFVGRYLVKELNRRGFLVMGLTRSTAPPKNMAVSRWFTGVDYTRLEDVLPKKTEALIHLAADISFRGDPVPASWASLVMAQSGLTALTGVGGQRLVFASTQMVYGESVPPPVPEKAFCRPTTAYGLSKLATEGLLLHQADLTGVSVVCLRIGEVFGFGQNRGFVGDRFINEGLNGRSLALFGPFQRLRDFVYVKDVARAISMALESEATGVFNIGGGKGVSLEELAAACIEVLGEGRARLEYLAGQVERPLPPDFFMNIEKARRSFGYEPRYDLKSAMIDIKQMAGREKS